MSKPLLTNKPDEYIAKNNANWLIIIGIIPTIALFYFIFNYAENQQEIQKNPIGSLFTIAVPLLLSIFCWYNVFDKRIKLVVNEHGIWFKKHGLLPWSNIDAYYFEMINANSISYILWIDTKNIGESISIDLTLVEENCANISDAIQKNSKNWTIRYSGIHKYRS